MTKILTLLALVAALLFGTASPAQADHPRGFGSLYSVFHGCKVLVVLPPATKSTLISYKFIKFGWRIGPPIQSRGHEYLTYFSPGCYEDKLMAGGLISVD